MRRVLGLAGVLLVSFAAAVADGAEKASADVPPGPRLAFTEFDLDRISVTVRSVDAKGGGMRALLGGALLGVIKPPLPLGSAVAWSADGSRMLFAALDRRERKHLYVADAAGRNARKLAKTRGAERVAISPDGRFAAFSRLRVGARKADRKSRLASINRVYDSTTAWLLDMRTGQTRQLTRWRDDRHTIPTSFSPDGMTIAASRQNGRRYEALGIDLASGRSTVLARNAVEPVFSPDGSKLAFAGYRDGHRVRYDDEVVPAAELYVRSLADGTLTRLTSSRRQDESEPAWDPSGERLAYTRTAGAGIGFLGVPNLVMQVNADGSCARPIYGGGSRAARSSIGYFGPSWQPGPGREAGPIAC